MPILALGTAARDAAAAGLRAAHEEITIEHPGITWTLPGHIGASHDAIDVIVHEAVERSLYNSLPRVLVTGEEVHRSGYVAEDGLIALVDPVDGTWQATALLDSYSCVVLLYRNIASTLVPVAASIATATHRVFTLGDDGCVRSGNAWQPAAADRPVVVRTRPMGPNNLCMVGAKPSTRDTLRQTGTRFSDSVLANLGGTPTIGGLILGDLSATLSTKWQSPWDAAHLLIGVHAGAAAVFLDQPNVLVGATDLLDVFANPVLNDTGDPHTIPPYVLGTDSETVMAIAREAVTLEQPTAAS